MKFWKKIKLFCWILILSCIVIAIYIGCEYVAQNKEQDRIDRVQDLISQERSGNLSIPSDETESPDLNLGDLIHDSIGDAVIIPVFSDISMINSSTFTATLNGETKTYHLIGVADDGDANAVQLVLEALTSITITHDTRKEKDSIQQIYLWNGGDGDLNNLINIQIVKQKICGTSYLINSGLSETPNIKYSSSFVAASK